jgi:hypothetical protein
MHSHPKFCLREGGVSYIDARKERFRDAVLACILLRKNFQNGVLVRSVTKILLLIVYSLDRRLVWLWWGMLMPIGMPC